MDLLHSIEISIFPVEADQNIITIPERHHKVKTASAFINDIKKKINKIK